MVRDSLVTVPSKKMRDQIVCCKFIFLLTLCVNIMLLQVVPSCSYVLRLTLLTDISAFLTAG